MSTLWDKCSPTHDKLSLSCLSESYVFAGCPFSSKIFPVPFFNRGKTGKLGRTEIEQSEHSQKIIGGVVYAELIVWASIDFVAVAPLPSLHSACSHELPFYPLKTPLMKGCSSTPLHHHCTCLPASSWAQVCWCQGSLHTAEACWHPKIFLLKLRNQEVV